MNSLLKIENLSIQFPGNKVSNDAVNNINFHIDKDETLAIIGESGSGKSVTALSLLRLLPKNAIVKGAMLWSKDDNTVDLARLSESEINQFRGRKIGMIFQEPMTALNPLMTCGKQVMENLKTHKGIAGKTAYEKTIELFSLTELPDPKLIFNKYPHQVSGGQKQRVMIAMAVSSDPHLLIADEPTTALDVITQKSILSLLKKLQCEMKISILLITHDLALAKAVANRIIVMHRGCIVESGSSKEVLTTPVHAYTKSLIDCRIKTGSKGKGLSAISEIMIDNEKAKEAIKLKDSKTTEPKAIKVEVKNLTVSYSLKKNIWGRVIESQKAVDNVSFLLKNNETLGLVGGSGCGKTTIGKVMLNLIKPTSGEVRILNHSEFTGNQKISGNTRARTIQMIFQDPYNSLNPRISIGEAIAEPIRTIGHHPSKNSKDRVNELLESVGLKPDHYGRYPHEFSGGQRQRICIARALALEPSILVFDESLSALDVSVQAQMLNLIDELKSRFHFSSLFIAHDLNIVYHVSDRIIVMKDGKIVEEGAAENVFFNPQHEYTKALISAIPDFL
jgi:peptide/nickel transport system ATP-binding protein